MFTIDPESHIHPYQQLAAQLRERIATGEITRVLPSLTELEAEAELSKGTVQRAIRLLVDEGLVFTVQGRGVYVRQQES